MLQPIGFWSYARQDDARSDGRLSQLRKLVGKEIELKFGVEVALWQDVDAIAFGADWADAIERAILQATFFIPILTPRFLRSEYCRDEFVAFRRRMHSLGRNDLVFPIHYINCDDEWVDDTAFSDEWATLKRSQWIDFRPLLYADPNGVEVRRWAGTLVESLAKALRRTSPAIIDRPVVEFRQKSDPLRLEFLEKVGNARTWIGVAGTAACVAVLMASAAYSFLSGLLDPPDPSPLPPGPFKHPADTKYDEECDQLAASPLDKSKPAGVNGVTFYELDANRAIPVCRAAVLEHPQNTRLRFELGRAQDRLGLYSEAHKSYEKAAEQGFAPAQVNIGIHYERGQGVVQDYPLAMQWYEKAAGQGYEGAQFNMGVMFEHGRGVGMDLSKARLWFKRAADQGDAEALAALKRLSGQ